MKIIYITNARIPTEKAHGLQIMKMCEAFASLLTNDANESASRANKFEVELIVPKRVNSLKGDPFDYYGVKRIFNIKKVFCLDLFWFKIMPAKISFYIQWFSFAVIASIYAMLKYQKTGNIFYSRDVLILFFLSSFDLEPVAEIHDYKADKPKKWWIGYAMKNVKKIITNSEGTKIFLQEHYDVPDNKFLVAPNGVDIDFFNIAETKKEARARLNLLPEKVIISYIGRLETLGIEKGVSDLIKAFGHLRKIKNDICLCIIGGPDNLINKYNDLAGLLGIDSQDIVFTGQVQYILIPLYLKAIDIVVVPFPATKQFSFTASPIKIFEFMAAGKIIVASDLPALCGVLNERNCIFFKSGDFNDLADKLLILLSASDKAVDLSNQARLDSQEYTWKSRAEKIVYFISSRQ